MGEGALAPMVAMVGAPLVAPVAPSVILGLSLSLSFSLSLLSLSSAHCLLLSLAFARSRSGSLLLFLSCSLALSSLSLALDLSLSPSRARSLSLLLQVWCLIPPLLGFIFGIIYQDYLSTDTFFHSLSTHQRRTDLVLQHLSSSRVAPSLFFSCYTVSIHLVLQYTHTIYIHIYTHTHTVSIHLVLQHLYSSHLLHLVTDATLAIFSLSLCLSLSLHLMDTDATLAILSLSLSLSLIIIIISWILTLLMQSSWNAAQAGRAAGAGQGAFRSVSYGVGVCLACPAQCRQVCAPVSPHALRPSVQRGLYSCQKRPILVSKEAYTRVKIGLFSCQKRPIPAS